MRIPLATMLSCAVACATAPLSAADSLPGWTAEMMMNVHRIGNVIVSPDGKHAVYTVRRAVMDADRSEFRTHISLTSIDGKRTKQLTQGDVSCDDPQWSPDGMSIAFVSLRSGKKNLWIIHIDGGEAVQVTSHLTDVTGYRWSPSGRSIAYTALEPKTEQEDRELREKNDAKVVDQGVKLNHLHLVELDAAPTGTRRSRRISPTTMSIGTDNRTSRFNYDWSPDESTLVVSHVTTPRADDWTTADLSLIDVASGTAKPLVQTKSAETAPLFSPDGKSIAYVATENPPRWSGARRIHVIPSSGGTPKPLSDTYDSFGRHSELVGWSADGTSVYFTETHGTSLKLLAMPVEGSPVELSAGEGMMDAGMSFSGVSLNSTRTHFGFSWERRDQPPEACISEAAQFNPVVLSRVHREMTFPPHGHTKVIRWPSTEALTIEGLLTYPTDYQPGRKYPLLVVVHGGPMGVFTQSFDGAPGLYPIAAFASRGYLVLRPNPRGSSGYGRAFRAANYADWGGGDFRDVIAGVDHLIQSGSVDHDRLGMMGWSYGGYLTAWSITQTKRFRAVSIGAAVTNLYSFASTTDIPGFVPDYFGSDFWDNPVLYRAHSPMSQIKGVATPALIQHGERDERVPLSQSYELYSALKRQGCTAKMIIYPRSPHSLEEPRLQLDCMNRNLHWFDQYLGPAK